MRPEEFDFIASLLKQRSGLQLTREKIYLLENRLTPIARQAGLDGINQLVQLIQRERDEKLIEAVTEAMTTNESFFFRDGKPFDLFREHVMPSLRARNAATRRIRIWCAAASTGQEPYSLAMILNEDADQWADWRIEILATDLSKAVLNKARAGIYSQFEVQRGLPIRRLMAHFEQTGEMWQLKDDIRKMVQFQEFNLLNDFRTLGKFDVVFCRNVLIYFDQDTKADILNRIHNIMPPHGMLFLGAAETVLGITDRFKPVPGQRGLYVTAEARAGGFEGPSDLKSAAV
ncbi:MAG: protein-glutamate O-methyltransferase CheR [Alphaproteobacteria bacterium]|nr:MAG: protein-glutamate O-methyltransferase CheR [Alphaproteobacteria bacterium]